MASQEQIDAANALISQAWSSVIDQPNEWGQVLLPETLYIQVARGEPDNYPSQYAALSNNAMQLSLLGQPPIINCVSNARNAGLAQSATA